MTTVRRSTVAVGAMLLALLAGCSESESPSNAKPAATRGTASAAAAPSADAPSPAPSRAKAAGIVFAALQGNSSWLIEAIDPATGKATYEAQFTPRDDDVKLDSSFRQMAGGGPLVERGLFSPDLQRAVASRTMTDGPSHVGWIDRDGTFTDITEANAGEGGFASTTSDDTPLFGPDGAFYFARRESDGSGWKTDPEIWRLTGAGPGGAAKAKKIDDVNYYVDAPSEIKSLCAGCSPFRTHGDKNLGAFRVTDFLGEDEYLSTDSGHSMIYRSPLKKKGGTTLMDWGTDGTPLIPKTNRTVWAPVAAPQGGQVAFLSKTVDQGDTAEPQLYVTGTKDRKPRLVTTATGALEGGDPTLLGWL